MNPLKIYSSDPKKNKFLYVLFRNIAYISAVFVVIVCIFMILNFIKFKTQDPLNLPQMEKLIEKSQADPQNQQLKQAIRELDLLARKAYFSSLLFSGTGTKLIIIGVIVFLIALKILSEIKQKLPDPGKTDDESEIEAGILAKWGIGGLGLALIIVALSLRIFIKYPSSSDKKSAEAVVDLSLQKAAVVWPAFRGRNGLGVSSGSNVPVKWDGKTGEGILWETELPALGFNSPVVWEDKVFVSGGDEDIQEIYCIDAHTGKLVWQKPVEQSSSQDELEVTEDTGYAAPSLTVDGKHVYGIFATGMLACFDFNGKSVWVRDLGIPENHYGHSSSLILYAQNLIVQFDHGKEQKLMAFNKQTGKTKWVRKREVDMSWASPVIAETKSGAQIILNATPFVSAYNAVTGDKIWELECMDGEVAPSAGYENNLAFVANEYAILAAIDVRNGKLVWEYDDDLPEVSSPLAVNGLLFTASSGGTVTCFEQKTGKVFWTQEFDDGFYSSAIFAEGRVYLMDIKGIMYIFKAEKTYQLISKCEMHEDITSTPSIVNNRIYIRGEDYLYCIGSENGSEK